MTEDFLLALGSAAGYAVMWAVTMLLIITKDRKVPGREVDRNDPAAIRAWASNRKIIRYNRDIAMVWFVTFWYFAAWNLGECADGLFIRFAARPFKPERVALLAEEEKRARVIDLRQHAIDRGFGDEA